MELAVNRFFEYRPASQWAFDVEFSNPLVLSKKVSDGKRRMLVSTDTFTDAELQRISQSVVSITQPKYDITPSIMHYGNFDFVVPIYDVNNIRMTVTFEDTDDCLISYKLLAALTGGSTENNVPVWLNHHEIIVLTIREYNTYQYDVERPNSFTDQFRNYNTASVKHYFCKLVEYTEPTYSRTTDSPTATTMTITFLAVPSRICFADNSYIMTDGVSEIKLDDTLTQLWTEAKRLFENVKTAAVLAKNALMQGAQDLKMIYERMLQDLGGNIKSRHDVWLWMYKHGLAGTHHGNGNCSRGIGMAAQLMVYIEQRLGIDQGTTFSDSTAYREMTAAHLVGYDMKGKYTGETTIAGSDLLHDIDDKTAEVLAKHNVKAGDKISREKLNEIMKDLGDLQYITFSYKYADLTKAPLDKNNKPKEGSQHIVGVIEESSRKYYFSDFQQNNEHNQSGISNAKDIIITGVFQIKNKPYGATGQAAGQPQVTKPDAPTQQNAEPVDPIDLMYGNA